jgi:hypothetical protein
VRIIIFDAFLILTKLLKIEQILMRIEMVRVFILADFTEQYILEKKKEVDAMNERG